MSQPTKSQVHVDRILTNISVAYKNEIETFIADKVFPNVPVTKQSDKYFTYAKDAFLRAQAERRSGAAESAGGGYQTSTDSYYCDQFSFHKDVPPDIAANTDAPLDAFRDAAEFVTHATLLKREADFVAQFFATGVWGKDITGVSGSPSTDEVKQWSDYTDGDPIGNIKTAKRYIQARTGKKPNTLVIGPEVEDALLDHPDIVDKMKYVAIPTPRATRIMLAQMFDVERVLVGESVAATSVEGQTITTGFQWGKKALLCYSAPRPSLMLPSAGYTFSWNVFGNAFGTRISRFPMRHLNNAERVEGDMAYDLKVVAADCGYFWTSIVA